MLFRFVALAVLAASTVFPQRLLTAVDLISLPQLSDPRISPDGKAVLFLRSDADWKGNKRVTHIWRVASDGSGLQQLTFGADGENSPRWSPDGKMIAFLAKRPGAEVVQVQILNLSGGEAMPLTSHETAPGSITWTPDSAAIYFIAGDPKTADEKAKEKAKDDVFPFDENYKQRHLWKVTLADKKESRLTQGDYSILSFELSENGKSLIFHRGPNPLVGDGEKSEVWIAGSDGAKGKQLTSNGVQESRAQLSPDGSTVMFTADANEKFESYYNSRIFLVPAVGGATKVVPFPHDVQNAEWLPDGKILVVAAIGVRSAVFSVDPKGGAPRQLTKGDQSILSFDFSAGGKAAALTVGEPGNPSEIWLGTSSGLKKLTNIYANLAKDFKIGRQEVIQWKGADGVTVEGLLYYPPDYQQGKRYPLCVQTHGGPAAADKIGFGGGSSVPQLYAAKGYVVLQPNYRGSTGYGDSFLRDMVGHYFHQAHLDVMAGVDHLIQAGIADPDRMIKMGWSGGGHMTNKIITFTDRFKAASSGAGAANWVSMYAQSDTRTYRTPWFGGTPWQSNAPIEVYWNNSPLKDAAKVKTPTLFLVGQQDPRVPAPQSVEMYRALKSNGVPAKLYMAPREGHGWQELRHQLFKINVELDWFSKYVFNQPYTWEKAPGEGAGKSETPSEQ